MKSVDKNDKKSSPNVGHNIRAARQATGLTLADVCAKIGITVQALSAIERGVANPSKQTLISLARVLENDFGETWLRGNTINRTRPLNNTPSTIYVPDLEAESPSATPTWDELILQWAMEAQDAAKLPRPVRIFNQKSALIPIHSEIVAGSTILTYGGEDKVSIPYTMIPSLDKARCLRITGEPIRDALIGCGDIIVLCESSLPEEDEFVLALVDDKVVIRWWKLQGRKVIFTAADPNYEPLIALRKKVEFIGKIMGVLRFI